MHRLDVSARDIGGVGWRWTIAKHLAQTAKSVVIIDGNERDWAEAPLASVRDAPAVIIAVVRSDGDVPRAADACDLCVKIGEGSREHWQFVGDNAAAVRWIDERIRDLRRAPRALTALARMLRATEHTRVIDAIAMESSTYSMLQAGAEHLTWLQQRHRRDPPTDEASKRVTAARSGGRFEICLTRPARRNALDARMRDELYAELAWALDDPEAPVITLLSEGSDFSSGGDLDEFGCCADPSEAWQIRLVRSLPELCFAAGPRLVIGIQGAAIGAGIELAAFGAHIVGALDSRYRLPEASMGLIPGSGGTVSLPRRIGRRATFMLALAGSWVDAASALALGLIDEVCDPHDLGVIVRQRADEMRCHRVDALSRPRPARARR